ncbi:MAG: hypothetical protein AAF583_11160 [Pseudomonadota bacterium]
MGTRHFIGAICDGEFKIAQYGQWDGYLDGQGIDVLRFIQTADMSQFRERLRTTTFLSQDEIDTINTDMEQNHKGRSLSNVYPHVSRDAGSDILTMVYESDSPMKLLNRLGFVADSVWCEYGYVLDTDNEVLEVYTGFNQTPLDESERFFDPPAKDDGLSEEYFPIRLAFKVPFSECGEDFTPEQRNSAGEEIEEDA